MEPTLAEIRLFGGNFAPRMWAFCDGQLLPISQNQALFSLLGTIYGGDGRTTFALPDLRGRSAVHAGHGPGLSDRRLGAKGGTEYNILNTTQLPSHNHSATGTLHVNTVSASSNDPSSKVLGLASGRNSTTGSGVQINSYSNAQNANMAADAASVTVGNNGGNLSVNNMQPFLAINFIIATQGIFPSRG